MADAAWVDFGDGLAGELDGAGRLLETLAVGLCIDPVVYQRHGEALQGLDLVTQVVGQVADLLRHRGTIEEAVATIRLGAMQDRLTAPGTRAG